MTEPMKTEAFWIIIQPLLERLARVWPEEIEDLEPMGPRVDFRLDLSTGELICMGIACDDQWAVYAKFADIIDVFRGDYGSITTKHFLTPDEAVSYLLRFLREQQSRSMKELEACLEDLRHWDQLFEEGPDDPRG